VPGSVNEAFVVHKVALGQVFLGVLLFHPVDIIPSWFPILIYHLGMNNRSVCGCSSETSSDPIDMNDIKNKLKV
jgi:hypothetical protein